MPVFTCNVNNSELRGKSPIRRFIRLFAVMGLAGIVWMLLLRWNQRVEGALAAQSPSQLAVRSAASYNPIVAPESIVAAFGLNLTKGVATATDADANAPGIQLPTLFGGASIEVNGRSAGMFFVSPGQINFQVPPDLEPGTGYVTVRDERGVITASGDIEIRPNAPSLFTANSDGKGLPAGYVLRVKADGGQVNEPIFRYDQVARRYVPRPIKFGPPGERVFLVFFITGARRITQPGNTRILIGSQEFVPYSIGAAPGFVGLEQVNFELPRTLSGRLSFLLSAIGYPPSNVCEIEIEPPTDSADPNQAPRIDRFNPPGEALAGDTVEITGSNFSAHPSEKPEVLIADSNLKLFNAQVEEVSATNLKVKVPFGAGSGSLIVRTPRGEHSIPFKMRTSMSGIVQTLQLQPDGTKKLVGLKNVTIRFSPLPPVTTNDSGSFILPGVLPGNRREFEVDGTTVGATPSYGKEKRQMLLVVAERDNQYPEYIELKQNSGLAVPTSANASPDEFVSVPASVAPEQTCPSGQPGQVIFETNGSTAQLPDGTRVDRLTVTVLDPGRTPADLTPADALPEQFSSTIVQLTPFGARITPGGKLTFPNTDCLPPGSTATLFRFDQTPESGNIGRFVSAGTATVSADGLRIETARDAIKEATYYFVSVPRATTTMYGSVVEEDDRPARGALVQVRGKSIFALTDDNGAFYLTNVPILKDEELTLEVSYLRPDRTVDRTERGGIRPGTSAVTFVSPAIVLPGRGRLRTPVILAPRFLTIEAGKTANLSFIAYARGAQASLSGVTPADVAFASVNKINGDLYNLRLAPGANVSGNFTLPITARDSQNLETTEIVLVEVKAANSNQPIANSQSLITDEDVSLSLTLQGSGGTVYRIVNPPRRGSLSGTAPNLVYTPEPDYNGLDSFSFTVSNGITTSSPAVVTLAIRPKDDPPRLDVGAIYTTNIGSLLNVVINGFDVDAGQKLTLTSSGLPLGATITQTTATSWLLSWTPKFDQIGSYSVALTLRDDGLPVLSDSKTMTIAVDAKWAKVSQIGSRQGAQSIARLGNILFVSSGGQNYRSIDNGGSWHEIGKELGMVSAWAVKGNLLFAAARNDLYRSADQGINWTIVSFIPRVTALAVKGEFLFAVQSFGIVLGTGGRIYRSADDGRTWTSADNGMIFNTVTLLARGNTLFAGTYLGGVFRSTNDGNGWVEAKSGLGDRWITSLAANDEYIFAGSFGGGVFRSADNATTWTQMNEGLTERTVNALAVKDRMLFVGLDRGIFRSLNQGISWQESEVTPGVFQVNSLLLKDDLVFAAATTGGVYRSINNGANWAAINVGLGDLQVFKLIERGGALIAGTEYGIYRSTDNGASWISLNNGLPFQRVTALAAKDTSLFVGIQGEVYRSTDNGLNWKKANNGLEKSVISLFVKGELLFAGTELGGVYRSIDNGENWVAVNEGLGPQSIETLHLKDGVLYAGIRGEGIYRTTNDGTSWVEVKPGLADQTVYTLLTKDNLIFAGTQNGVYRALTPSGENWITVNRGFNGDRVLYITSLVLKGNVLFANQGSVYRSNDDGINWKLTIGGTSPSSVNTLLVKGDSLFAGDRRGVYLLAESPTSWRESNFGLPNQFVTAATVINGVWLIGAESGGVFKSTNNGENWIPARLGLPPVADVRAFAQTNNGILVGLAGEGVFYSTDEGQKWTARNNGLTNQQINVLASNGVTVYAGTNGGVFRSLDGGVNWTTASSGLTRSQVLSLVISGSAVYAGTDNGLFRSTNQGVSWAEVSTGLMDRYIVSLGVAPDGTTLLAGTSSGLFRSTNQGQSWALVASGLPDRVVALTFAQKGARQLLMGTVNGFFVSEDNGASWRQINGGLLTLQVGALAVSGDTVLAGTRSGGVFISQLP